MITLSLIGLYAVCVVVGAAYAWFVTTMKKIMSLNTKFRWDDWLSIVLFALGSPVTLIYSLMFNKVTRTSFNTLNKFRKWAK